MISLKKLYSYPSDHLYIHIPFCEHICSYCDFCKFIPNYSKQEEYIDYLINDLKLITQNRLKTIYIGGGTPSYLRYDLLEKLLKFLNDKFTVELEFSFEANPESITEDKVKLLKSYNVNRISIGVQSLNLDSIKILQRNHDITKVDNSIALLQKNGIDNINLDFIYGLSNENINDIKFNLDYAISKQVKHVSYYALQIEKGTKLAKLSNIIVDDDKLADEYEFITSYLSKYGYHRYEVSNFALDNYESKHNLAYWLNKKYYGVGLSSSGYLNNIRYTITDRYLDYINRKSKKIISNFEILNQNDDEFNYLMLHLRLKKGFSINEYFNLYKKDFFEEYKKEYISLKDYFDLNNDYLSIKDKYLYILDEILIDLLHFKNDAQ